MEAGKTALSDQIIKLDLVDAMVQAVSDKTTDEEIYSQYVDYQFRPYENIYATIGGRNDRHTLSGDNQS